MIANIVNNEHEHVQGTKNEMEWGGGYMYKNDISSIFDMFQWINLSKYVHKCLGMLTLNKIKIQMDVLLNMNNNGMFSYLSLRGRRERKDTHIPPKSNNKPFFCCCSKLYYYKNIRDSF